MCKTEFESEIIEPIFSLWFTVISRTDRAHVKRIIEGRCSRELITPSIMEYGSDRSGNSSGINE